MRKNWPHVLAVTVETCDAHVATGHSREVIDDDLHIDKGRHVVHEELEVHCRDAGCRPCPLEVLDDQSAVTVLRRGLATKHDARPLEERG